MVLLPQGADQTWNGPQCAKRFAFAATIDVSATHSGPDEPSPCLPSATSTWYALQLDRTARLIVDLAPEGLGHVRFTTGGTEAVEHAVRMARLSDFDFYQRVRDKFGLR